MEPARPRILCLDDNAESLRIRRRLLEQFGYDVATVTDSCACLHLVAQESFDLVLLDYHLAEQVTGEDVARDISVLFPRLPLVMLTGDPLIPHTAWESVDAVVIKGAGGPGELLGALETLLPRNRMKPQRASMPSGAVSRRS